MIIDERWLVIHGDDGAKGLVRIDDISCTYGTDTGTALFLKNGHKFITTNKIDDMMELMVGRSLETMPTEGVQ